MTQNLLFAAPVIVEDVTGTVDAYRVTERLVGYSFEHLSLLACAFETLGLTFVGRQAGNGGVTGRSELTFSPEGERQVRAWIEGAARPHRELALDAARADADATELARRAELCVPTLTDVCVAARPLVEALDYRYFQLKDAARAVVTGTPVTRAELGAEVARLARLTAERLAGVLAPARVPEPAVRAAPARPSALGALAGLRDLLPD